MGLSIGERFYFVSESSRLFHDFDFQERLMVASPSRVLYSLRGFTRLCFRSDYPSVNSFAALSLRAH